MEPYGADSEMNVGGSWPHITEDGLSQETQLQSSLAGQTSHQA